jgi:hypothetical protein
MAIEIVVYVVAARVRSYTTRRSGRGGGGLQAGFRTHRNKLTLVALVTGYPRKHYRHRNTGNLRNINNQSSKCAFVFFESFFLFSPMLTGTVKFDKLQWKYPMPVYTKSAQWESSCSMWTNRRRTGRYDEANRRFSQFLC